MGIAGWAKRGHYRVDCVEGCVFPLGIGLDDLTTRDSKLYKVDRKQDVRKNTNLKKLDHSE